MGEISMFVKDVVVQNQVGLHARPATFFIQKANEFKSSIWVEKEERRVNAKSLLGILSLGIVGGTTQNFFFHIIDYPDNFVAQNYRLWADRPIRNSQEKQLSHTMKQKRNPNVIGLFLRLSQRNNLL